MAGDCGGDQSATEAPTGELTLPGRRAAARSWQARWLRCGFIRPRRGAAPGGAAAQRSGTMAVQDRGAHPSEPAEGSPVEDGEMHSDATETPSQPEPAKREDREEKEE